MLVASVTSLPVEPVKMNEATLRANTGRLGSRKSHNGCATCKVRKVKCDELHPACKRCVSTGRKCDYPQHTILQVSSLQGSALLQLQRPRTYCSTDVAEIRSFEFFIQRVVPGFTRIVDENFWHRVILQYSHTEPAVWKAVNALSYLIRRPHRIRLSTLTDNGRGFSGDTELRTALRWYGESIAGLKKQIQQHRSWSISCGITSILYICIECLQGNILEAVTIYHKAVATLVSLQDSNHFISEEYRMVTKAIQALLRHMALTLGIRAPFSQRVLQYPGEVAFHRFSDAKEKFYASLDEAHNFVVQVEEIKLVSSKTWIPSHDLITAQQYIQQRLSDSYADILAAIDSDLAATPHFQETYSVMFLGYNNFAISIATLLTMYETSYDRFTNLFQSMVDHASFVIKTAEDDLQPLFVFETRVLPSLFFVAIKCRHPLVRRRALHLLRRGPKMENIVAADALIEVVEKSIGIEESGDEYGCFSEVPLNTELPPENNRIYRRKLKQLPDEEGRRVDNLDFGMWRQDDALEWFKTDHVVRMGTVPLYWQRDEAGNPML